MLFLAIAAIARGDSPKNEQIDRFIDPLFREEGTGKHFTGFAIAATIIELFIAKSFNRTIDFTFLPRVIKLSNCKHLIPCL